MPYSAPREIDQAAICEAVREVLRQLNFSIEIEFGSRRPKRRTFKQNPHLDRRELAEAIRQHERNIR